jgi:hypothetical protein
MTKQHVPDATLEDAEGALLQEFGKYRTKQLYRDSNQVQWAIRLGIELPANVPLRLQETALTSNYSTIVDPCKLQLS